LPGLKEDLFETPTMPINQLPNFALVAFICLGYSVLVEGMEDERIQEHLGEAVVTQTNSSRAFSISET
jgi:hypothetical protein